MSWYFEYRPRIKVTGGIRAKSKRGSFGETWWGQRWVKTMESFDIGGRLERGRSYARGGQVRSIDIKKGEIKSKVQGSEPKPYSITIELEPLSKAQWKKVIAELSNQAIYAAKLLAGEMPQEIEQVFKDAGVPLFPQRSKDLVTDCSCPDYSNPCKHIAAVYYLLGEEFDRDPFLLFKLRGMEREALLAELGTLSLEDAETPLPPQPLEADRVKCWQGAPLPVDFLGGLVPSPTDAALPKRLGGFPFWRSETPLLDALEPIYRNAASLGKAFYLGEKTTPSA